MNNEHHSATRSIGVVLMGMCTATTMLAAFTAVTGGITTEIAGIRLSMHAVSRPVVAAVGLGVIGILALSAGGASGGADRVHAALARRGWLLASAFAVIIGLAVFTNGAHIAGGTDSSGYLSEARLWRAANFTHLDRLKASTPLARELTLTNGQYPFTPVGYQPGGTPATIVPVYPPGLPLHFAVAGMFGDRAQFAVVPLCAAGLIIVAFILGSRLGGADAALIGAALAGSSPILLYQSAQPMSDTVAAFWWTCVVLLLTFDSLATAMLAGIAAVVACAVRPNLFVMAPIVAVLAWWWKSWRRRGLLEVALFLIPVAAGAIGFALFQRTLYGSPSRTGYGAMSNLFSIAHVWPNLVRYPRWAFDTQSALMLASIAAPIAIRRGWITTSIDRLRAERIALSGMVCFACLQAFYLLYIPFDDWVYFRFLLPALPWLLVLEGVAIAAVCRRVPGRLRGIAVLLLVVLIASWGVGRARGLGVFRLQVSEQRYVDVAEFVRGLPPNAVVLSMQHSGSLSYYLATPVLRWDWIEPGELDRAIDQLSRTGRPVFAVLDDWEESLFRARFANTSLVRTMRTPIFAAGGVPSIATRVFAISGTTAVASASPVSWRWPPALRIPRRPGARDPESGSGNLSP